MKITIKSEMSLNKYDVALFKYLQQDEEFERLIKGARKKLGLSSTVQLATETLDIEVKSRRTLKSELVKTQKTKPDLYLETLGALQLQKEITNIVASYPFLQELRKGLSSFICGDSFVVNQDEAHIKLRVRNKEFPVLGEHRDNYSEEGIKIVLDSRVSKNELMDWIDDNWKKINDFLDDLPTLSKQSTRKTNYERDRLIVYLRLKWKFSWSKIGKVLGIQDTDYKTVQDRLQQAYKDFPHK